MLFTRGLTPVLAASIKVTTILYGVNVNIYSPVERQSLMLADGDLEYSTSPIFSGKQLIPLAVVKQSSNQNTDFDIYEEAIQLFTITKFPLKSKLILSEDRELSSFILNSVEVWEDVTLGAIVYTYSLLSSGSLLTRDETISITDADIRSDSIEGPAITEDEILPVSTPNPDINYDSLNVNSGNNTINFSIPSNSQYIGLGI